MKSLMILLSIFSLNAFAQTDDGYHVYPEITCTTGECLHIESSHPVEYITKYDMHGFKYRELNTTSSLLDIIGYSTPKYICYSGKDIANLRAIIEGLIGNTNYQYYQGGHSLIETFTIETMKTGVSFVLNIRSDYSPNYYDQSGTIKLCD